MSKKWFVSKRNAKILIVIKIIFMDHLWTISEDIFITKKRAEILSHLKGIIFFCCGNISQKDQFVSDINIKIKIIKNI